MDAQEYYAQRGDTCENEPDITGAYDQYEEYTHKQRELGKSESEILTFDLWYDEMMEIAEEQAELREGLDYE